MWNIKNKCNESLIRHPAIDSGEMTYTLIGCGDFYNQEREKVWCPWTQRDVPNYTFHVIGNADVKADFTHLDDFAAYLVATLCEPEKSSNAVLNFVSDRISYREIATLLERYSGKPVRINMIPEQEMHKVVEDPSSAPQELKEKSPFPVDFWFLVKGIQGQGRFYHPQGQTHNTLFPDVRVTTFDRYFQQKFA
jgi:hypothetical protein